MKNIISFLAFLILPLLAFATHNRAGEITYRHLGGLKISVTVTTYTKASSVQADRDSVLVFWGDGESQFVKRSNGDGEVLDNNVQYNTYEATHTYPGINTYTISLEDPNRVAKILNVNFPNSENIKFYIETTFTFPNEQFDGLNNSVRLLQRPIDLGCVGKRFKHLPNAYDEDGDSIAFELITPLMAEGIEVPDYELPSQILPGINNNFNFNTKTGEITWDSPQKMGEYSVAFRVNEYRKGQLINSMIRDMQIFVYDCNNNPPVIDVIDEICVIAGETVEFTIFVNDPDVGQKVKLEATGAPLFIVPNTAEIDVLPIFQDVPYEAHFKWETRCEDIANDYYQVVFRAVDNFFGQEAGLADLKAVRIKVTGPPPENLEGEGLQSEIELRWDLPYDCDVTEDEYFQGFSVWRRQGPLDLQQDTCQAGLSGTGYTRISYPSIDIDNGRYYYADSEVQKGITYCYRVEAEFAQLTSSGNQYNIVESLASEEICLQLKRDIPLLIQADVQSTDEVNGEIFIEWIKPDPDDLDTLENPGPYLYQLERANGIQGDVFTPIPGASFSTANFATTVNLSYQDIGLNTSGIGYNYRVAFYVNGSNQVYDYSPSSSSVFMTTVGTDSRVELYWDSYTSWFNSLYHIYRFDNNAGLFELIDSTEATEYRDLDLINGKEYCYKIQSVGSYFIDDIPSPLLNFSNEACDTPIDTLPPCIPTIVVDNVCDEAEENFPEEDFVNTISWEDITSYCEDSGDTDGYNIYFKSTELNELEFVAFVEGASTTSFEHKPEMGLIACYAITSVDSIGNESDFSQEFCISDCPAYILPNAFTPNGDGANDIFKPILNRFVSSVNMKIYTSWGQKVFETTDPDILWDGTNFSGNALPDGVYYYTCEVFRTDIFNETKIFTSLSGYIELLKAR